ncbi:immunoglobulin-like domain-containing protein [Jeotgalibacillus malaysiensis]|uniref:immunoglobulin-like domain-containing protein n=1 Tax=Jeotgalibacillus malaysiensis TaxID=1508404 RepID=UPI00384BD27B
MTHSKVFILLFLFSIFLLSACSNNSVPSDWEASENEVMNDFEGVTMIVKDGTVSSEGATLILTNEADVEGVYGNYYTLEKKSNDQWYKVPVANKDSAFEDVGYSLPPAGTEEWGAIWKWREGELDKGTYRIIKSITASSENGENNRYLLLAEFEVE